MDRCACSLAVHETEAPVGRHEGASYNGRKLLQHSVWGGAHEEVEVKVATNDPVADFALCQHDVHAMAVQQQHTMRGTTCSTFQQSISQ